MKNFSFLVSTGLCVWLWFFTGCSSNEDPKPFDCSATDLAIAVESKVNPTSCTSSDGSIVVSASGGTVPYTFSIDDGTFSESPTFSGIGSGTFSIDVKDKNGCTKSLHVQLIVTRDNPLAASATQISDTECFTSNGSIEITASGGTAPYQYKIGSGAFLDNPVFEGLGPGNYAISVRDVEGCVYTFTTTVAQGDTGITYSGDILPIFNSKCSGSGCHPSHGDLFTYDTPGTSNDAKGLASSIKSLTQSGAMPQGGATLTSNQKALIACWVDAGAPN